MVIRSSAAPAMAATWVDNLGYFGPDRRRSFHFAVVKERRVVNSATDTPSLWSALRKLRFHAIDAYGLAGVNAFMARTKAVALLAEESHEPEIWEALTELAFKLSVWPRGDDPRAEIFRHLDSICTRGPTAGSRKEGF